MNHKEKLTVANFYANNFDTMFPYIKGCEAGIRIYDDFSAGITLSKGEEVSIIDCKITSTIHGVPKASFTEIKFNQIGL